MNPEDVCIHSKVVLGCPGCLQRLKQQAGRFQAERDEVIKKLEGWQMCVEEVGAERDQVKAQVLTDLEEEFAKRATEERSIADKCLPGTAGYILERARGKAYEEAAAYCRKLIEDLS